MMRKGTIAAALATFVVAVAVGAGGQGDATAADAACKIPRGSEQVRLNPADFTTRIDNPYWPRNSIYNIEFY